MTLSIGLSWLFADLVILLVLAAALASPRISPLARLLIATSAFMCAWLLAGVFGALRAPAWTLFTGCAVIVMSIAVMILSVYLWSQADAGGESGEGHRGDRGGGGPRRRGPDAPQRGGGGKDPSWWPAFERQLAFYVAERDVRKQKAALLLVRAGAVRDDTAGPTTEARHR